MKREYPQISKAKRDILLKQIRARDGDKCFYCGEVMNYPTLEHIIPRSRGGEDIAENLVCCHDACNKFVKDADVLHKVSLKLLLALHPSLKPLYFSRVFSLFESTFTACANNALDYVFMQEWRYE